jgi:trehalose/maltose transport system substrate-binding protein
MPAWRMCGLVVLIGLLLSCRTGVRPRATITFVDTGPWFSRPFADWGEQELEEFTRETGISVKWVPAPEAPGAQLAYFQKLFESKSTTPDVYAIDVVWSGALAEHLTDLQPYLGQEVAHYFPGVVADDTVGGKLAAIPHTTSLGVLFYRTDLLQRYGFPGPPSTWDELQKMAAVIQEGERRRGNKQFWGFVWQGAAVEALTCDGLEWQLSEGGGPIVEADGTISVNNPATLRAWRRAAGWVGTISPPGVVAYRTADTDNIWRQGNAAFSRGWDFEYHAGQSEDSAVRGKFGVTEIPAGAAAHANMLGGRALAISRYSAHQREAIAFVRFMTSRQLQLERSRQAGSTPGRVELFDDRELVKLYPHYPRLKQAYARAVVRPSRETGKKYAEVSQAYYEELHAVLAHQKDAATALGELEKKLVSITGLKTRAPAPRGAPGS